MPLLHILRVAALSSCQNGAGCRLLSSSSVLKLKEIRHVQTKDKIVVEVIATE
jgi:hypothetical protein